MYTYGMKYQGVDDHSFSITLLIEDMLCTSRACVSTVHIGFLVRKHRSTRSLGTFFILFSVSYTNISQGWPNLSYGNGGFVVSSDS